LGAALIVLSYSARAQDKPAAAASTFKPVLKIDVMMNGQKKLFGEIKAAIVDEKMKEGESFAWLLAEIANVNHYQNDSSAYREFADQMSRQCVQLAELMGKGDAKLAKEQFSQIGRTCGACHDQFAKKK
jgi:hypothetical protein